MVCLRMGGFHTEKIFLACLSKYLEKSGTKNFFEIMQMAGLNTTKSALNGGHCICSKKGMCTFLEI